MSLYQSVMRFINDLEMMAPLYGGDYSIGVNPSHIHHSQRPNLYSLPQAETSHERQPCYRSKSSKEDAVRYVGKDGFQVCIAVQYFKPSELFVKVQNASIIVEGKHEEREDEHGYVSRHFVRRYDIPKDYDPDKVVASLSSDGVLTIRIPKPVMEAKSNEKVLQIQQTGPAYLNVTENPQEKPGETGSSGDKRSVGTKK